MKATTTLLAIATILASHCCATAKDQKAGKRRLGDPNYFSSTPAAEPIEILDTYTSISSQFASSLFGRAWSERKMEYFGGDEFIQMYDDKSETRFVVRGYIDLQVASIEVSKKQCSSRNRRLHRYL